MNIFNNFVNKYIVGKKDDNIKINLDKIENSKQEIKVCLEKNNIEELVAEVQLAIDISGSMDYSFKSGMIQKCLNRIIPISLLFDDDGIIPVYPFNHTVKEAKDLTINNLDEYSNKYLKPLVGGGTNYSPTLISILNKAIKGHMKFPVFVLFITDGENYDISETKEVLRELSNYDIYIQFVGVGDENFTFLKELDNLSGRKFDNAGFIKFKDFNKFNDKGLYNELLKEFINIYKKNVFKNGKIKFIKLEK